MAKVKVYSTPTCPYCDILEEFLQSEGIKFDVVDVSQDKVAQEYIFAKTGKMAVPVIEIDEEIIVGFDRPKIAKLLNLKD
ncbi:glutathione S-transferase N-terminal domain-containing protein [Patescibacteria group bacterium]|nr:glutathione S-transferase N-terminal domain-containing protein [Patescibacteria group bacterium]MBU4023121.1 glutathione S-transferase N-terminal domain-containing protein [Patescibacteria group bacterium]MBU4078464.1 glutathione S-transferase N-terminal domain-containing protein [Patescibacteria group bacterium]